MYFLESAKPNHYFCSYSKGQTDPTVIFIVYDQIVYPDLMIIWWLCFRILPDVITISPRKLQNLYACGQNSVTTGRCSLFPIEITCIAFPFELSICVQLLIIDLQGLPPTYIPIFALISVKKVWTRLSLRSGYLLNQKSYRGLDIVSDYRSVFRKCFLQLQFASLSVDLVDLCWIGHKCVCFLDGTWGILYVCIIKHGSSVGFLLIFQVGENYLIKIWESKWIAVCSLSKRLIPLMMTVTLT
jgi:hypothetical protein